MASNYDLIIIGSGPAGMTAGIYAKRSGLNTLIIEKNIIGGQASLTYEIKNYPGFETISGMELGMLMQQQAESLGCEFDYENVKEINLKEKTVITDSDTYTAKSIILALGAAARHVGVDNEENLIGKGVAYCAMCDGAFFKDENVALIGGGNTAIEDAIYLSKICKSVTIVNNLPQFTCQQTLKDELNKIIEERNNITIYQNSIVNKINGEDRLNGVEILNTNTNETTLLNVTGMFVAIGRKPDTDIIKGQIDLDKFGYIIANEDMHTSVDGVFVAGDVRVKNLRQIITACADGAIAATEANTYISKL